MAMRKETELNKIVVLLFQRVLWFQSKVCNSAKKKDGSDNYIQLSLE